MKDKAIIFDIDGTAIDSPKQKTASKKLIDAIEELKNSYYLSAATGRVWSFAKPVLQSLKLSDPCIISAGTQICNPITGEILWQKILEDEAIQEALQIFKGYPKYRVLYNDATEEDYFSGGDYPENVVINEKVYFLELVFIPDDIAKEAHKKLNKIKGATCIMVTAQKPGHKDLHIINKTATKEQAVAELLKILGVERINSIGIGDGANDMHLFNAVNYKVAMRNATQELKEVADKIIGHVIDDGMAKYLNSLIPNKLQE